MISNQFKDRLLFGKRTADSYQYSISFFLRDNPDVQVSFEKPGRVCPYYVFSVDKLGTRRASFCHYCTSAEELEKKLKTMPDFVEVWGGVLVETSSDWIWKPFDGIHYREVEWK